MDKYFSVLEKVSLFEGIQTPDLQALLQCVQGKIRDFPKDSLIIMAGSAIRDIGIILRGEVRILKEDVNGHRNILAHLGPGDVFGEIFACAGVEKSPVSVESEAPVTVLFIDFRRIVNVCESACRFHSRLLHNMLKLLAQKNLENNAKISCLGRRTIREKVEAFLALEMEKAGANPFSIPYSRSDMADYLCVDRSALSSVLSQMRGEGLIDFSKNHFHLLPGFGE